MTYNAGNLTWGPGGGGSFTANGDLTGNATSQTVIGLDGYDLPSPLVVGNLGWNGEEWILSNYPSSLPPNGIALGDLSGSYPNPKVSGIDGYELPSVNPGALYYDPTVLGLTWGSLPIEYQQSQTLYGDVTGSTVASKVVGLDGYSLPALSTGNLNWSGYSWAFTASPTSLPPSGFVPGGGDLVGSYPSPTLGVSGVSAGTYGDSVHYPIITVDAKGRITSATLYPSSNFSLGGDLSGSNATQKVIGLDGYTLPALGSTSGYLEWTGSVWALGSGGGGGGGASATYGLSTSRPAATGSGSTYFCTDIPIMYIDSVSTSQWQQFDSEYIPKGLAVSDYNHVSTSLSINQMADTFRALVTNNSPSMYCALTNANIGSAGYPANLNSATPWIVSLVASWNPAYSQALPSISVCVADGYTGPTTSIAYGLDFAAQPGQACIFYANKIYVNGQRITAGSTPQPVQTFL